jgi:hypothetical protein
MVLTVPDDLRARLERLAAELGFAKAEDIALAILHAETSRPVDDIEEDDEFQQLLMSRIESDDFFEMTPEWVEQFKKQLANRQPPRT